VTEDQRRELEVLVRNGNSSQKMALRCKILLLAHQGVANAGIADQLKISRPTVLALRAAFTKDGLAAVTGIRRRRRSPKVLTGELEQRILNTTLQTRPGDGSTHWSVRTLAAHLRVSRSIVHRVWQRHDVQPHRVERFKLSNDPRFEEKVRDIVGLYLRNGPFTSSESANEEKATDLVDDLIRAEFAELARQRLLTRSDNSEDSGDRGSGAKDHEKRGSDKPEPNSPA